MLIQQKRFLLLLALAAGLQFTGFAHSVSASSVPFGNDQGKPVYKIHKVVPEWWLYSTLEEVYEDEYTYYDTYFYKVVFDTQATGYYSIKYKVSIWAAGGVHNYGIYYASAEPGDLEVELGVFERYYSSGTYWKDTEVSVMEITE